MLSLDTRITLLDRLGKYMLSDDEQWQEVQHRAYLANTWFTPAYISLAIHNIATAFLQKDKLEQWVKGYNMPVTAKNTGIVMAGNIPLVGFHDFLCAFICGHKLMLKLSSKDEVLIRHIIQKLVEWEPVVTEYIKISDMLKGCDAYIATGSNNTARYFEQYFGKYPHIIRKNRTSVALLDGSESDEELNALANDVFVYFGLGCRNITQVCVPKAYDFDRLLKVFTQYDSLMDHHKYKNNYDYHLALYLLNKVPYITNNSTLMIENTLPFSAVSVVHYRFYEERRELIQELTNSDDIQCIVGHDFIPFGDAQKPSLTDYSDGVDTLEFLCSL